MSDRSHRITRPRLLRYSLRTMLVFVLVLSVWLAYHANRATRQRQTVEAIRAAGGQVAYDYEYPEQAMLACRGLDSRNVPAILRMHVAPEPGPDWLRQHLGVEWFADVVAIALAGRADDQLLGELRNLPELRDISICSDRITDDGLRHMAELPKLEHVDVGGTNISHVGLEYLRANVRRVHLLIMSVAAEDDFKSLFRPD